MPQMKREFEEIEINLDQPEPLSKKEARLQKKGKVVGTKEKRRRVKSSKDVSDLYEDPEEEDNKDGKEPATQVERSEFGVWIGNMSFDTSRADLRRFLTLKSEILTDDAITRINMPKGLKGKGKGFAYVDFQTEQQMQACVALSEQNLNGRNLLIKNAKSFEGRPHKEVVASRILFVGNLAFDTTSAQLQSHFEHCGEIIKIRMATFEDNQEKCKGFAFVDFKEPESATKALADKRCRRLFGRVLRMEYGEDRSQRRVNRPTAPSEEYGEVEPQESAVEIEDKPEPLVQPKRDKNGKRYKSDKYEKERSVLALASAQRGKVSIAASAGKKITFA